MARPLRIEIAGGFYHVTSRGNERKNIFFSRKDYAQFRSYLEQAKAKYNFRLHCYILMTNHYHLLIETLSPNLSKIMHFINSAYANYINRNKERIGHLFQGRYKAILIDKDSYLLESSTYIHLNPVRAKITEKPEDYPYSSYVTYITEKKSDFVYCDLILGMIATNRKYQDPKKEYKQYVERELGKEIKSPFLDVRAEMILGSDEFYKKTLSRLGKDIIDNRDVSHRKAMKSTLDADNILNSVRDYFHVSRNVLSKKRRKEFRDVSIYLIKKYTSLSNSQIGHLFGDLTYSAIAKAYQRFERKLHKDQTIQLKIKDIMKKLSSFKG